MSSGYLLRVDQARAARSAAPCDRCGHPHSEHLELPSSVELVDGQIVTVPHPDYRPAVFHCRHDGCDCVIDKSGGSR